jgi:hypothetical protein
MIKFRRAVFSTVVESKTLNTPYRDFNPTFENFEIIRGLTLLGQEVNPCEFGEIINKTYEILSSFKRVYPKGTIYI